eukprot:gene12265-14375_t
MSVLDTAKLAQYHVTFAALRDHYVDCQEGEDTGGLVVGEEQDVGKEKVEQTVLVPQLGSIYFFGGVESPASTYVYAVQTDKWRKAPDMLVKRKFANNAVNADGTQIFVFGGGSETRTFERFNTATKQGHKGDITTYKGGEMISTCYDGQRYIYLLGGYASKAMSRLDRFDTVTLETQTMGDPRLPIYGAYVFVDTGNKQTMYIVGGISIINSMNRISTLDLDNLHVTTFIDNPLANNDVIAMCCYDGAEYIYIVSRQAKLTRISIKTKQITTLACVPNLATVEHTHQHSLVHCVRLQRIYLFHRQLASHYNITTNQWTPLTKPPISLECSGIVGHSHPPAMAHDFGETFDLYN